jgi:polysaccharide biosynthesis transport protein
MAENVSDKQLSELLGSGENESGAALDFGYYFHLLLRYLWLFLLIVAIALGIAAYLVARQPIKYVSRAVLQVETQEQKVLSTDDVQTLKLEGLDVIPTIVANITSDSLLVRVAKAADLLDDPTFFPPKPDGQPYGDTEVAGRMKKAVSAGARKLTRLIDISVTDTDPERAKLIADTLVREFMLQTLEQRMSLARTANEFLRDEANKLKGKLEDSEERLQRYKEEHNAVSLEETQNITVEKLKELNSQVTAAKSQRLRLESDMEILRTVPADDTARMLQIGSVAAIPQVQAIRGQIVTAEAELAAIQKRYGAKHPKNIQAVTQLNQLKASLTETLKDAGKIVGTQYESALETEKKLNEALKEQEQAALELNKIAIPYNVLLHEVESDRAMYDAVNNRLRETSVSLGIEKSPYRIVEEPLPATTTGRPWVKILGIGLFLGVALAAGTILGLDMLDSSLRYVDEAERFLRLPVLGVVSEATNDTAERIPNVFTDGAQAQPAEAFRSVRTTLSLLTEGTDRGVFLVTSPVPGEGKTFCAFNLAVAFALEGQETVLVDADLRLPAVQRIFPDTEVASRRLGLSDYLAGKANIDQILIDGPEKNLSAICAGTKVTSPGELLGVDAFATLIRTLEERFDRVVIDSAPVNAVSDPLRIMPLVSYVCLVIRAAKTPKKAIARARKLIENAKGKLAGFILNRVRLGRDSDYYFYQYAYGDAEAKGSRSKKKA